MIHPEWHWEARHRSRRGYRVPDKLRQAPADQREFAGAHFASTVSAVNSRGARIVLIIAGVIALAVGICEGKQMGDNTKASVITRGLAETSRLALALGGEAHTMAGDAVCRYRIRPCDDH